MTTTQTGFRQDAQGSYIDKDPAAQLTYVMDWSDWMPEGDSLSSTTFSVPAVTGAANVTIVSSGVQGNTAYVELAGGTAGTTYTVINTIVTADGKQDRRRFRLRVTERYA